jgi:hypothetical protein
MMGIGDMRVVMGESFVPMGMRVRLLDRAFMLVPVVLIMDVEMIVLENLVRVEMAVTRPGESHDAEQHHRGAGNIRPASPLFKDRNGQQGSQEGGRGEEHSLSRGAQKPERIEVEHDTQAIAQTSKEQRGRNLHRGPKGLERQQGEGQ